MAMQKKTAVCGLNVLFLLLSGQGKGGERPWEDESSSRFGLHKHPRKSVTPEALFCHPKPPHHCSSSSDFQSARSPRATPRASP